MQVLPKRKTKGRPSSFTRYRKSHSWDDEEEYNHEWEDEDDYEIDESGHLSIAQQRRTPKPSRESTRIFPLVGNLSPANDKHLTKITPDKLVRGHVYFLYNKKTHEKAKGRYVHFEPNRRKHKRDKEDMHFNYVFEITYTATDKRPRKELIVVSGDTDQYRNPGEHAPTAQFEPNFAVYEPKSVQNILEKHTTLDPDTQKIVSEFLGGKTRRKKSAKKHTRKHRPQKL